MDNFLKATACILVALIFYLVLLKQGKDISSMLAIVVCVIIAIAAIRYLEPVIELLNTLQQLGKLDNHMLRILMQAVGIGLLAEITSLICSDSGNTAMAKTLQILASAVILWLSIPLLTEMINMVREILQAI